jgi:hypothetical protein
MLNDCPRDENPNCFSIVGKRPPGTSRVGTAGSRPPGTPHHPVEAGKAMPPRSRETPLTDVLQFLHWAINRRDAGCGPCELV